MWNLGTPEPEYDPFDDNAALNHLRYLQAKQQESNRMPTMRGQLPQWSPGEFEEWKRAKTMGVPTMYGQIMQRRHRLRGMPMAPGQLERENEALAERYPDTFALNLLKRQK